MAGIEAMVRPEVLNSAGEVVEQQVPAKVGAYVSLDQGKARGVHMSRLYLHAQQHFVKNKLTPRLIDGLLTDFLESHSELSQQAEVEIDFSLMLERPALVSDNTGFRTYPIRVGGLRRQEAKPATCFVEFQILYSSTCPCSTALSSEIIKYAFEHKFPDSQVDNHAVAEWLGSGGALVATPHAQRSEAKVWLELTTGSDSFQLTRWLDGLEQAIQTPVQAAVKRADEQEFAIRNATNLMFTEDAARRLASYLHGQEGWQSFHIKTSHLESLHPHDAVAEITGTRT